MKIKISLGLLSIIAGVFVLTNGNAYAVSGSCYFNSGAGPVVGGGTCSVSGLGDYGTNDVLSGRDIYGNGNAIPDSVNSKSSFIDYILNRFNAGSSDQNRIGSAFIMQEMRGHNTWPDADNVDNWVKRMQQDNVTVSRVWDGSVGKTSWYDNNKKNTFYADHPNVGRTVIVIKQNGKLMAKIEVACGNMVAGTIPIVQSINWEVTPKTDANSSAVQPGDPISWSHSLNLTGPDDMDTPVDWEIRQFKKNNGDPNVFGSLVKGGTINDPQSKGVILSRSTSYSALADDVGKRICQYIRVKPYAKVESDLKNSSRSSDPVCVQVKKDVVSGDFIPNAVVSPDNTEPNTKYYWHATVTDGVIPQSTHPHPPVPQKEDTITWEVHKIIYPATLTGSYVGGTGAFACPVGATCTQESSPPGHALKRPGSPNPLRVPTSGNQEATVPDNLSSGSRICYVSSVHLPKGLDTYVHTYDDWQREKIGTDSNGDPIYGMVNHPYDVNESIYKDESTRVWRHSAADCVTVAKRPRVQIRGEDISARGDIITSVSKFADVKTFGSWVEYGAFSLGDNVFMASGAGYSEGSAGSNTSWSKLTFANNGVEPYGSFGSLPESPKIAEYYASKAGSGWAGLGGASGIFKLVGNQTISGTNVAGSYVIYSTGDVTIDNNIAYKNGPFAPGEKLPQVIIIAKNIKIKGNVTQIDAWLVTTVNGAEHGSINTCVDVPDTAPLTDSLCSNQLTVNGPVITGNLLLRRTFGAKPGVDRGVSAEIFRLRPDAYLWGYQQSSSSSIAQTVDISELPPRF